MGCVTAALHSRCILRKKTKLVYGVGINDSLLPVVQTDIVNEKKTIVWICPYYKKWRTMLQRCTSKSVQNKYPNYKGCYVCDEWKYFSNFKEWVDEQPNKNWEKCELDKDLLFKGNKCYSPTTCIFISKKVNTFINNKGVELVGASWNQSANKFQARVRNSFTGKEEYLGLFHTQQAAHDAWKARKLELLSETLKLESDGRLKDLLINLIKGEN